MLSLPNIAQRHGKITGSMRALYPLNNDPIIQNRLYWTEEFDNEFLPFVKNNNKTKYKMNTSTKLKSFTYGAPVSAPYANADGPTDYSGYATATSGLIKTISDLFNKNKGNNNVAPPVYIPVPPPTPAPTTGWSMGTKIAVGVGAAVVLTGAIFGIRALVNRGK